MNPKITNPGQTCQALLTGWIPRVRSWPDTITVLRSLPVWFEDYNEHHPHWGLGMRSLREFIHSQSQPAPCPV